MKNAFASLEDALEAYLQGKADEIAVEEYLDALPNDRATAETLLDMVEDYDGLESLWRKLLVDCDPCLTEAERRKCRAAVREIFEPFVLESFGLYED